MSDPEDLTTEEKRLARNQENPNNAIDISKPTKNRYYNAIE